MILVRPHDGVNGREDLDPASAYDLVPAAETWIGLTICARLPRLLHLLVRLRPGCPTNGAHRPLSQAVPWPMRVKHASKMRQVRRREDRGRTHQETGRDQEHKGEPA